MGGRAHGRVLPGDPLEQVADPALLLLLGGGEQEELLGRGHVVVHCQERVGVKGQAGSTFKVPVSQKMINILVEYFKKHILNPH